jgi:O-antigen biosynthesis protein WbqV
MGTPRALNRRQLFTAFHDTVMAAASFLLALYLRLGDDTLFYTGTLLPVYTALCACICLFVFSRLRLYRGLWRYASTPDLVAITKAVTIALLLFYLVLFALTRLSGIPRSAPFIQWLLLLALLGGPRFFYRILRDRQLGLATSLGGDSRIPVLLIGAGDRAELFLRDTRSGPSAQYQVVGILDDNPLRTGHTIHNVRIFGRTEDLSRVVEQLAQAGIRPQRIILTYDMAEGQKVRGLFNVADSLGLPLARLPRLAEFKEGMGSKGFDIRPIAVEDLLGRAQNVHDKAPVGAILSGKVVLVTGAGGTIGAELVRQIASFGPKRLVLLELSEYALYRIDLELARDFPGVARSPVIGDVRNRGHLAALLARERPQIVFHAAAIKHVPLAEANPEEAALTNVLGTSVLADACVQHGVGVMVLISTDKAINPSSVMGATKRVAESYCQALGGDPRLSGHTRFVAVRFGNVLGSTGSVVPLFEQQLKAGGPLTVTHRDMVRYFMTVREAVELVLQAGTLSGQNGEVYVLDMGQPVRILDLAEQMIRLSGLKPYQDINIEFTGLRPGEKMFEELFHPSEASARTAHEGIWLAGPPQVPMEALAGKLAKLYEACNARDAENVVRLLKSLVPEYSNSNRT